MLLLGFEPQDVLRVVVGIALGLLASLTPAADWVAALADKFVWLVEFVL